MRGPKPVLRKKPQFRPKRCVRVEQKQRKGKIISGAITVVPLERRNVHIGVSSERRNVHNGCSHVDGRAYRRKGAPREGNKREGAPTEELSCRCTPTYVRSKRSVQSSVISGPAQLREYRRRTRRAGDEHCLLLVWIGLEAIAVVFCEGQR